MSKKTLSNKTRYSILKLSGFRSRMQTPEGRKIIQKRRKRGIFNEVSKSMKIKGFVRSAQ